MAKFHVKKPNYFSKTWQNIANVILLLYFRMTSDCVKKYVKNKLMMCLENPNLFGTIMEAPTTSDFPHVFCYDVNEQMKCPKCPNLLTRTERFTDYSDKVQQKREFLSSPILWFNHFIFKTAFFSIFSFIWTNTKKFAKNSKKLAFKNASWKI
jgi:hypothetical protein